MHDAEQQVFLADVIKLRQALLLFASKMLQTHGEFYPFAKIISSAGKLQTYGMGASREGSTAQEIYESLHKAVSVAAKQEKFRAVGFCSHVKNAQENMSAVRILLEYRNGTALQVIVRYGKDKAGKLLFAPDETQPTAPTIF